MKKITAISAQKRNPERVNIFLDGEFAFGLARITAAWLKTGDLLSQEKIDQLLAGDLRESAQQQALLLLSYRARSEDEIRRNLRRHEYPDEVIEQTLERLRAAGLADDGQFAKAWVENRSTFRPRGKRALTMELRQKGLDDGSIQASLAGLDEEALALQAAQKRAARLKDAPPDEFRSKLGGFLARRGFNYSVISAVVSRMWEETHSGAHHFEDEDSP